MQLQQVSLVFASYCATLSSRKFFFSFPFFLSNPSPQQSRYRKIIMRILYASHIILYTRAVVVVGLRRRSLRGPTPPSRPSFPHRHTVNGGIRTVTVPLPPPPLFFSQYSHVVVTVCFVFRARLRNFFYVFSARVYYHTIHRFINIIFSRLWNFFFLRKILVFFCF